MSGYRVCRVNDDGTASITTPVPDTLNAALDLAAKSGGEVVSAGLVAALRRGDQPAGGGVPAAEFKRRLALLYYVIGTKPEDVQRRWDRVLSLLDSFDVIFPDRAPVSDLVAAAVGEGLLTADQAAALAR